MPIDDALRRAKKRNCATLAETYGYAKPNDWRSRRAGRIGKCVVVCKPCTTRCGTDGCTLQSTRDLQSVQELQVLQALLQRRWHLLRVPLTPARDSTNTQCARVHLPRTPRLLAPIRTPSACIPNICYSGNRSARPLAIAASHAPPSLYIVRYDGNPKTTARRELSVHHAVKMQRTARRPRIYPTALSGYTSA
jgi:hypothetical protein